MIDSARAVSPGVEGSMLPASISRSMCRAVASMKYCSDAAVRGLDLGIVGRGVGERLQHGAVAGEDVHDARESPRG